MLSHAQAAEAAQPVPVRPQWDNPGSISGSTTLCPTLQLC